ncbi:MAG: alpha/beta fold hydrolase [Pseudonocardia sp.]
MNEQSCRVGDIELCYESLGDPEQPTVLLIMGLGLTMDWWRDDFCAALVARGFHVVRFDNRDVGRSTTVPGRGISAWEFLTRRAHPDYTLGEMADDAAGLIAALDPRGAHVVGASMGGMIAQEVAIRHPALTRSLVSIMARPGDRRTGKVAWRMRAQFLRPPSADPVEAMVQSFRRIGSVGRTERDDEDVRATMHRSTRRSGGVDARSAGAARDGTRRQLAACVAERDRTADLRRLPMPTLVLHGAADKVILPSGGRATAAAIPGAERVEVPGMGHDLPRWVWPTLIDGIARTAARSASPTS